ncbi:GNAT family N-acetyltransferase [Paeniglutamicibacter sp. NPDC012692]|uniref:GNAT family N-acetyltransferase n=1 Tax=Paeniglutamicibacter sp. NPDC012692 TaxID=3364388 RepID=UPI003678D07E
MDTSAPTNLHTGSAWPLLTERLGIRPATPADAEATWAYRRLPESSRWVTAAWKDYESYARSFRDPAHLGSRLVVESDGRVIGEVVVRPNDAWTQREASRAGAGTEAELGWSLDPAFAGRGLATEAVERVLRLCFTDLGLRRVHARCFADNRPSWRLMERLGMRRESHLVAAALHRDAGWLDGFAYAMLAEEWRDRQPS